MSDRELDKLHADAAVKVKSIAAAFFSVSSEALKESTLVDDISGWDSTSQIGLILTLESELGIEFPPERITAFESIGELIDECVVLLNLQPRR